MERSVTAAGGLRRREGIKSKSYVAILAVTEPNYGLTRLTTDGLTRFDPTDDLSEMFQQKSR